MSLQLGYLGWIETGSGHAWEGSIWFRASRERWPEMADKGNESVTTTANMTGRHDAGG